MATIDVGATIRQLYRSAAFDIESAAMFAVNGDRLARLPKDVALPDYSEPTAQVRHAPSGESMGDTWPEVRESFADYCTRYAVIAMVTTCEILLGRLLYVKELTIRAGKMGVSGENAIALRQETEQEVRYLSPERVIRRTFEGLETPALRFIDDFRSIYALRRCLVHRSGIVSEQDVDKNGVLAGNWRHLAITVEGKEVASLPTMVPPNHTLGMPVRAVQKEWRVGERLGIDAQSSNDIAFSLMTFCGDVADILTAGLAQFLNHKDSSQEV